MFTFQLLPQPRDQGFEPQFLFLENPSISSRDVQATREAFGAFGEWPPPPQPSWSSQAPAPSPACLGLCCLCSLRSVPGWPSPAPAATGLSAAQVEFQAQGGAGRGGEGVVLPPGAAGNSPPGARLPFSLRWVWRRDPSLCPWDVMGRAGLGGHSALGL